jgi:hypothetical protein
MRAGRDAPRPAVHLVVLREPHLSRVLSGEKKMEGRFCRVRRAPMGVVSVGDILLLKRAAGPVCAWCRVSNVLAVGLAGDWLEPLRECFDDDLGRPGDVFWASVAAAKHATLIELEAVTELDSPVVCRKRDQRGWVVLRRGGD